MMQQGIAPQNPRQFPRELTDQISERTVTGGNDATHSCSHTIRELQHLHSRLEGSEHMLAANPHGEVAAH